ncbi:hypothetical protein EU642_22270 [Salmonella enterica]|nr:hypothetical protein [Salmonella enterica]EAO0118580.1 hypothetical protein [Salmonella enterica]EAO3601683.1 hypothetical protein [Salmonella enterica]EAR6391578.1 hypothetical protein [Salmonella enterica]EAV1285342.1 hypothetical protein [Salmonella enterica]
MRMKVKMETPSGIEAVMTLEGVRYRHYNISKHAIERYTQRANNTLDNLFVALDRAVLADASRSKDHRVQQQIRKSERNGGYAMFDPETNVYFFMAVGPQRHTICTIMTREIMVYANDNC